MDSVGAIVTSGNLLIAFPLSLLAGIIAFASPCVLPLIPGYLGYIGGFTTEADRPRRGRMLAGVGLFVLGFSIVFVGFSILFGAAGFAVQANREVITRIAGVVVILLGLVFIGQFTFLQRTIKPRWATRTGLAGAPLLGIVFGIGWTPCIGPTLGAVFLMAGTGGSPARGALLGLAFCIGLGVPFLLVALGFNWVTGSVSWMKRHIRTINVIGGSLLVLIGVLMVSGVWQILMSRFLGVTLGFIPAI